MDVSRGYEVSGRTRQKQRTRNELIAATRQLIGAGVASPTVEQAASAAAISRTTAYRYFASQRELLVAAHPEIDVTSLLGEHDKDDVEGRFLAALAAFSQIVVDTEVQQRTMLRLSLEEEADQSSLPLRQGRAVGWFVEALAPLLDDLGEDGVRRLAVAVRSVTGIEAFIWLVDVAGLSREEAVATQHWNAVALLQRACSEGPRPV